MLGNLFLSSTCLLVQFDAQPLKLSCDASPYGIRAALFHEINGQERLITFPIGFLSNSAVASHPWSIQLLYHV